MTFFWSSWITILSIMCWAGILGVLLFVLKYKPDLEEDGTTGHTYDGIREYDKPLPKWWLVIFFGSIIWGAAYWVFFPAIFSTGTCAAQAVVAASVPPPIGQSVAAVILRFLTHNS